MKGSTLKWGMCCLVLCLCFTDVGCAPKISKKDQRRMQERSKPLPRSTDYVAGLRTLQALINSDAGNTTYFQVKAIDNITEAASLPDDLSEMVITSVNSLQGEQLQVVSYYPTYVPVYDPGFAPIYKAQLEAVAPQVPNLVVAGGVTEFDENISKEDTGWEVELWWDFIAEGEEVDIDLLAEFDKSDAISRIALDLRLLDYKTRIFTGLQVSNTILVFELEREKNLGFMIYSNGISRTGRIKISQGLHQAVRNLIDYSVLQLVSMYYTIPFWRILDDPVTEHTQACLTTWRRDFLKNLNREQQIGQIQLWLMRYHAAPVYVDRALIEQIPETEYGRFGRITQAFALKCLYQYAPEAEITSSVEQQDFPQDPELLGDLYRVLLENVPLS